MKRLLLPLLVTAPILATLAPEANAAAISHDPGELSPRRLGRAALTRPNAGSVPTGHIKILRSLGSSNEIVPTVTGSSVFGGTLDLGTGGAIKTGAGTLSLTGSGFLSRAGSVQISEGITLDGGNVSISTGVLTGNSGSLLSGGLVTTGAGTLTLGNGNAFGGGINGGVLVVGGFNEILVSNGGGNPAPLDNSGSVTNAAPAAAPVPEPGSAILFAIGVLAASQARRRRAV